MKTRSAGATLLALFATASPRFSESLPNATRETGQPGGALVVALRSEPKTLNPVTAIDSASREVLGRLMADLIHIDRETQRTEPGLAESWTASADGRHYTVRLRKGLSFSDGHPMDADDVVFTFAAHLDPRSQSAQRDLLIVGGRPIEVTKLDSRTVRFDLAEPYAAAERLFDGFYIVPRHRLERAHAEGRLAQAWDLATPPAEVAGLGPFRVKDVVPGQRLVLERNPHYWKTDAKGQPLPYLEQVVFVFVTSEDAQVIRFQAGETDIISRVSADNLAVLESHAATRGYRLFDLGPGLEYVFLLFNQNELGPGAPAALVRKSSWFRLLAFRKAVSSAIDRDAIARLAFRGRGIPLYGHVTPGYKLWVNRALPRPPRSLSGARQALQAAGFSLRPDGVLLDPGGEPVTFSVVASAANAQRLQIATLVQNDLKALGIEVHVVPLENRAVLKRVLETRDYEAALLALGGSDADPNTEMSVWLSTGATHLWHLGQKQPATPWEAEIDDLMRKQMVALDPRKRKRLYDRVQELVADNLPILCLVSPHILVGAKEGLGNFRPAVIEPYGLWNAEELFWRGRAASPR